MTNKTEMVSDFAALTYKELAERLAHYLSSALVSAQYSMTDETMHDALGLCDQVTRRKSAPAEDVRAVVEEYKPVAVVSATDGSKAIVQAFEGARLNEGEKLFVRTGSHAGAVVDDPVAYVMPAQIEAMKSVGWMHASRDKGKTGLEVALYSQPQRPLVLPERYDESQYRGTSLLAVRRWNACLDAVEELNK